MMLARRRLSASIRDINVRIVDITVEPPAAIGETFNWKIETNNILSTTSITCRRDDDIEAMYDLAARALKRHPTCTFNGK